jgi:REP-associated tyrosine transposase
MRSETHPPFRKLRRTYDIAGHAHELTFSCLRGLPLLDDDRCRSWFVLALDNARRRLGIEVWAYVIMPEHVHVLVYLHGVRVREILTAIKQSVARKAISRASSNQLELLRVRRGRRLAFWQPGGGYDRNVYGDTATWAMIDYIHNNPVRRGLVETPLHWKWSSARWYAGDHDVPLAMDLPPQRIAVRW